MAELHRPDKATYFSRLVPDLTKKIDQMLRPINTGLFTYLARIDLAGEAKLTSGQHLLVQRGSNQYYYSLVDQQFLFQRKTRRKTNYIDLQKPGDTQAVYLSDDVIFIGTCRYQLLRASPDEIDSVCLTKRPSPERVKFRYGEITLGRGAQGFIYFSDEKNESQLYRLNIHRPTQVERLTWPVTIPRFDILSLCCLSEENVLVLTAWENENYRWNLDTNEMTPAIFLGRGDLTVAMDPLTGISYQVKDSQVFRQDGALILDYHHLLRDKIEASYTDHRLVITLAGQILLSTWDGKKVISHLLG